MFLYKIFNFSVVQKSKMAATTVWLYLKIIWQQTWLEWSLDGCLLYVCFFLCGTEIQDGHHHRTKF
jgi:hypothetical protein